MKPMRRGKSNRTRRTNSPDIAAIGMREVKRHLEAYEAQKRAWDDLHRKNIAALKFITARGYVKGHEERCILEDVISASSELINKARGALGNMQEFGFDKNQSSADDIAYLKSAIETAKKLKRRYEAYR